MAVSGWLWYRREVISINSALKNSIGYAKAVIEHLPSQILNAADSILDDTFHQYEWGKLEPDDEKNREMRNYRIFKQMAVYMLTKLLSVDENIIEEAIFETAQGYSKGNLRTYEITRQELIHNLESLISEFDKVQQYDISWLGIQITDADIPEYLKDIVEYAFEMAIEKYKIQEADEHKFSDYLTAKTVAYYIVFNIWGGNYFDTHDAIEITVKECFKHGEKEKTHLEHYLNNLHRVLEQSKSDMRKEFMQWK